MNFRDELEREAQQLPVNHTDLSAIVTTARVRTRRRRAAVSTVAACAVIAGTAVGIQQLSAVRTERQSATAPTVPAATVPASTDNVLPTTTAVPIGDSDLGGYQGPHFDNATPAQLAAPNVTWSVVDPHGPEALAYRFNPTQNYALATEPSTSPGGPEVRDLYQQVNGVWTKLDFQIPDSTTPILSGDTVYGVGLAPATPGAAPGSFGTYDVASGTWQMHEFPPSLRPHNSDNVSTNMYVSTMPIDGGVLVVVQMNAAQLYADKFPNLMQYLPPTVDGNTLTAYTTCDEDALSNGFDGDGDPPPADQVFAQACTQETFDGAQLGLSQADLDALQRPAAFTLWKVTADSMVPFDTPGISWDGVEGAHITNRVVTISRGEQGERYVVGHDGSFQSVFTDLPMSPLTWETLNGMTSDGARALAGVGRYLLISTPDAPSQITDLTSAAASAEMLNPTLSVSQAKFAGALTVAEGWLSYDDTRTLVEPTTITDSGYSLVMADGTTTVIDNATGQSPANGYELSTESGKVELLISPATPDTSWGTAPPNTVTPGLSATAGDYQAGGEFVHAATFDIDWTAVPGLNSHWRYLVFTTSDGVNVAATDIGQVLDISPGSRIMDTTVTTNSDGHIVISGNIGDRNYDKMTDFMVVGTPN